MRTNNRSIRCTAVLLLGFAQCIGWAGQTNQDQAREIENMLEARQADVKKLISIVESEQSGRQEVALAMRAIGKYRATEAVPVLVSRLDYVMDEGAPLKGKKGAYRDLHLTYPAMTALIEIGLPSVDALLDVLATDEGENKTNLADVATLEILGKAMRGAAIQEKLKTLTDTKKAARLRAYAP